MKAFRFSKWVDLSKYDVMTDGKLHCVLIYYCIRKKLISVYIDRKKVDEITNVALEDAIVDIEEKFNMKMAAKAHLN